LAVTNPFDDADGTFLILINDERQHSLWPSFAAIPNGWDIVHGPESRESCMAYVRENWTDMRPASLAARISAQEREGSDTVEPGDPDRRLP
jgi:MbtH protein